MNYPWWEDISANLCVLQASHGRGSWNFESQGASATGAAAGEFTETYQNQKGSMIIYMTLTFVATSICTICWKADQYIFFACAEPAYDGVNFRASKEGKLSIRGTWFVSSHVNELWLRCNIIHWNISAPALCWLLSFRCIVAAGEVTAGGEQGSAEGGRHMRPLLATQLVVSFMLQFFPLVLPRNKVE